MKKTISSYFEVHFNVCKRLLNDYTGVARGIVFQETRSGAGFKTGDFAKEKSGEGLLPQNDIERLICC